MVARKKAYLIVPPTGLCIREDRYQTPIRSMAFSWDSGALRRRIVKQPQSDVVFRVFKFGCGQRPRQVFCDYGFL